MSEHYVARVNDSGSTMNGDLDDTPKLFICQAEDQSSAPPEKKKVSSTSSEKRKDKIRYWINRIGEQLPPVENPDKDRVGRSTLEIVEKAWSYIVQLKEAADPACRDKIQSTYVDEVKKLKNELEYWKQQALKLQQQKETLGHQNTNVSQSNDVSASEVSLEKNTPVPEASGTNKDNEKSKLKTKKRNTISVQLETLKKQQQENATQIQQSTQEMLPSGIMGNYPTLMDGGANQHLMNQQMLMNTMMFGASGGGGGNVLANTALGHHGNAMVINGGGGTGIQDLSGMFPPFQGLSLPGQQLQCQSTDAKGQSAAEAGAGLLQLAMQDAGITPSSQSAPSEENTSTSVTSSAGSASHSDNHSSALHTLASIASNTQNITNASQMPASQGQSNSLVTQGGSGAQSSTTQSINTTAPIMATGQGQSSSQGQSALNTTMSNNSSMMNMPFVNGQQIQGNVMANGQGGQNMPNLPNGQNAGFNPMAATQQIMFINEQGIPCVANIPVGMDPASLGIPNTAKQIMGVDKSGNVIVQNLQKDQNQIGINEQALLANTLAQQQMNLALQGQLQGQFQGQNNVAVANPNALVQQPMNNQIQLNPQMMQQMGGQITNGQLTQTNQGLILPASQTGNILTVNSVPTQQSQLPQALLLPNGQIIPVVSNPNLVAGQQGPVGQLMGPNGQQINQGGNLQQRMPLPPGIIQNDPNSQVIMTSSGPIQIAQPQMSLQPGVSNQTTPSSQGLLMTTSSVLPMSPSASSSTASQSTALVSSSAGVSSMTSPSTNTSQIAPGSKVQSIETTSTSINTSLPTGMITSESLTSTPQTMTLTSSDANSSNGPITVLNPQLQSALQGQLRGSTAPILLTMDCNGQATSILVDPTSMQVLGTVQTQQPTTTPSSNAPPTSSATTPPGKKGKKNHPRSIFPKPQGNKGTINTTASSNLVPTNLVAPTANGPQGIPANLLAPSVTNPPGMWITTKEGEQPMDIVIPNQTQPASSKKSANKSRSKTNKSKPKTDNSVSQSIVNSSQDGAQATEPDILAKAAESIFSSEISPGNFYNPANEDNPLQIDTSVCDGEEENPGSKSPLKNPHGNKNSSKPVSSADTSESDKSQKASQSESDKTDDTGQNESDQQSKENEILDMFKEADDNSQMNKSLSCDPLEDILMQLKDNTETPKKSKKDKKKEEASAEKCAKDTEPVKKTSGKKGTKVKEEEKESNLVLPETITFSATDLPDVLDQVEQLGSMKGNSPSTKKSKSKKGRSENSDQEPANKKRKKNSGKEKNSETNVSQKSSNAKSANSMSVYDFDDDDFSTPLFQVGSSRLPTNSSNKNGSDLPTPTSQNTLFSMPILSEPCANSPLFEEVTTPKKRTGKQKGKKIDSDKVATDAASKKSKESHEIDSVKSNSEKGKDTKKSAKTKNKTNKTGSFDSFGFDDMDTSNDLMSEDNSRISDMSEPLFKSADTRKEKEEEKPNMNEPLFGSFDRNHGHKAKRKEVTDIVNETEVLDSSASVATSNPLTVDTSDIDSDMNNILGLSPRMISPAPSLNSKSKQAQKSPQLQTPKSTSPVTRVSPVSMASTTIGTTTRQSQILPSSNDQIMSRASSNTANLTSSVNMAFSSESLLPSSTSLAYSAESLFSSQNKSLSSPGPLYNQSLYSSGTTNSGTVKQVEENSNKPGEDNSSRPKSIYSAENFVQSSRQDMTKSSKPASGQTTSVISPSLPSFGRSGNDSSDGFNFASIGLNLQTPTTSSNSLMDSLSVSPIITTMSSSVKTSSTEFTFTLTTVTTTVTTSNPPLMSSSQASASSTSLGGQGPGQGSYPFFPPQQSPQRSMHQSPKRVSQPQQSPQQPKTPVTSSSPQRSGGQVSNSHQTSHRPQVGMPNFDLDLSHSMGPTGLPHVSQSHDGGLNRPDRDTVDRMPPSMPAMADPPYSYGLNSTSQPLTVPNQRSRDHGGPPPREQPPLFPNITVSTHEGPLNMGINKTHSEMRHSHKRINEMNQRNVPPKSQTNDVRNDRSAYNMQPFYAPTNFSPSGTNPLETAPLHHPPLMSGEERPSVARSYDPVFPPAHSQTYNSVSQNFNNRYETNTVPPSFPPRDGSGTQPLSHTPPSQNMDGRKSANPPQNQNPKHSKSSRSQQMTPTTRTMNGPVQNRSGPTPPQGPGGPSHRPTPPHQSQQQPVVTQSRPKSTSRSAKQSQKKKMAYGMETELPPHHAMFDPNRVTPFLGIPTQALSPPSRNIQTDGPSLFGPGNLFGASNRKGSSVPQNTDLSAPFNSLFPPTRSQNGLGFNFQPGFGMNSMHGAMSNSPQITPHSGSVTVTPHMSNFNFTSIFSDPSNSSQNDSLNISPIKFPPNPMLPHQGMDPNSLHHAHQQGSSLYHQHRPHPPSVIHNAMNINSILGHNHHGFESRGMGQGMNTSVAPPFPGHGHPASFAMPPLNFSMHDH